jgi:hypothetical protein
MNANEVQIKDIILVRRSNEKKFREGVVLDIQTMAFAGFESIIALVAFDKATENVNLDKCEIRLTFRDEVAA